MAIHVRICCDRCNKYLEWKTHLTKQQIAWGARDSGWTVGKRHLCKDCQPKPMKGD